MSEYQAIRELTVFKEPFILENVHPRLYLPIKKIYGMEGPTEYSCEILACFES